MSNINIIAKTDMFRHQKLYYRRNKDKLNKRRVLANYKHKYSGIIDTQEKLEKFRKHKKLYLQLKLLDKELLTAFSNLL